MTIMRKVKYQTWSKISMGSSDIIGQRHQWEEAVRAKRRLTISPDPSVCQVYENDQPPRAGSFQCPWRSLKFHLAKGNIRAFSEKLRILESIHTQYKGIGDSIKVGEES